MRVTLGGKDVLKGVTVTFQGKHILLGPNGHGKTTLFKTIAGLYPFRGIVLIEGIPLSKMKGGLGMLAVNMPEVYNLAPVTAWETALLYSDIMDVDLKLVKQMLSTLGLSTLDLEKKKMWELSAGTIKAFCTTLALASGARNILLDEPFEQLDPAKKVRLVELLEEYGGTLVLNTHETWVLNRLDDWQVNIMIDGRAYGPVIASRLAKARVVSGATEHTILSIPLGEAKVSFVDGGEGEPVTGLLTLDRLYDIVLRGV
ncbi:MAG: ATP-binding cassette domain-containing protein [Thermofilaceae archaeon]|nr:ATP-binding cassette domain-containing protein [Thermofilaceae archaeon]